MNEKHFGIRYTDSLAHHGIVGQKWGIRRYQNPDGSLTPEGKLRYRNTFKDDSVLSSAKNQKLSSKKIKKAMQIRNNYVKHLGEELGIKNGKAIKKKELNAKDADVNIKTGSKLTHISTADSKQLNSELSDRPMYVSFLPSDVKSYKGFYGTALRHNSGNDVYENTVTTKREIKVPSHEKQVQMFTKFFMENPDVVADGLATTYWAYDPNKRSKKEWKNIVLNDFPKSMIQTDAYLTFITGYCLPDEVPKTKSYTNSLSQFKSYVNKNGYNALIDENDVLNNSYMLANKPLILLNPKETIKSVTSKKLSPIEMYRCMTDEY